jgi:predicted AlkP superfamily pyrophosphatase or phosphodiesterase
VLPAGQHPDAVSFYDTKRGSFTSSTWYAGGIPKFLADFQTAHPISAALVVWEPVHPEALLALLGPDAQSGEGDWLGLGNAFPHDVRRSPEPLSALRVTPFATEYLFDVARAAVRGLALGADEAPDLLMLSVSPTDYAGHVFGPESWEYVDSLVRLDRALTRFLNELPPGTRVLLSSDHGAAPLPERSLDRGHLALRVRTKKLAAAVNAALAGHFGLKEPPVASYTEPFVYFSKEAQSSPSFGAVLDAVAGEFEKAPGVAAVYSVRALLAKNPENELETLVRGSLNDAATGELFVVPSELSVVDPTPGGGKGTSHGSPWEYDRFVPVLFWGDGVTARAVDDPVPVLAVAPTLARLLGVPAPDRAEEPPLPGAP